MALMGIAFLALTIVLIVFQPGSPRHKASAPGLDTPTVTRVASPEEDVMTTKTRVAEEQTTTDILSVPQTQPTTSIAQDAGNVRDMTFAAISNLKSATTGETPAPGQPGSLLHSVVQRSLGETPTVTASPEPIAQVTETATHAFGPPKNGRYFVLPGDTLTSIAEDMYGDADMATTIFQSNLNILARPDSLRAGMVLALPSR